MKKTVKKIIATTLVGFLASTAIAQDQPNTNSAQASLNEAESKWYPRTGGDLLNLINGCEDASCMSFVSGAISGLSTREFMFGREHPFCTNDTIEVQDIKDALQVVIGNDEELQQQPVTFGILATFAATWPCDETQEQVIEQELNTLHIEDFKEQDAGTLQNILDNHPPAFEFGDPNAPIMKTIVVFHDPNCQYCQAFKSETSLLAEDGWRIVVMPISFLGEESNGYSAVMYSLSDDHPEVVEALYEQSVPGKSTVDLALQIAGQNGVSATQIFSLLNSTDAHQKVQTNNDLMDIMNLQGTPGWLLSDYGYTGFATAKAISDVAKELPPPPGEAPATRPGIGSETNEQPLILE